MDPLIRVVLLNWNDRKGADRCIDRLEGSEGVRVDILLVDNGSSRDDAGYFRDRLGPDRVRALADNTGYAGGMNAGMAFWRAAGVAEPVLIITPDAAVGPETLRRLWEELDAWPGTGIVGPVVVYSREGDGRMSAGGEVDPGRVSARLYPRAMADGPYPVDWIDGCCMLVRPEVLDSVEPFDERFFIYYEETDFCTRVKRAGWEIHVVPAATVDHPKQAGTLPPYYFYYMVRNRYLFWRKHSGIRFPRVALVVAGLTLRSWLAVLKWAVLRRSRGEARARLRDARLQLRAAWFGTLDHFRGCYGRMSASRMPRSAG